MSEIQNKVEDYLKFKAKMQILKQEIVEGTEDLIRRFAQHFAQQDLSLREDLMSVGRLTVLDCLDGESCYDPLFATRFTTYLYPRVRGKMQQHVRDYSALIRVPERQYRQGARCEIASLEDVEIVEMPLGGDFDRLLVLNDIIARLPEKDQRILNLYKGGYTFLEIACRTHLTSSYIQDRLQQLFEQLKQEYVEAMSEQSK